MRQLTEPRAGIARIGLGISKLRWRAFKLSLALDFLVAGECKLYVYLQVLMPVSITRSR